MQDRKRQDDQDDSTCLFPKLTNKPTKMPDPFRLLAISKVDFWIMLRLVIYELPIQRERDHFDSPFLRSFFKTV